MKHKKIPKPIKKRLINAYFISTLSITLVLFLIGLLGLIVVNVQYLNQYIRENIGLTLVLDEDVREVDLMQLQKVLSARSEVKSATYINSDQAASDLQLELGEDFISFLGFNPLNATIDVKLYSAYTHNDSLASLETLFMELNNVKEVYYQRNLVSLINENSQKIGIVLLALAGVMLLIFMALINNTIRLSIYSKRFIINTMQLVGATRPFIRRPFVSRSVLHGLLGGFFANLLLAILIFSYFNRFGDIINTDITGLMVIVFALVFIAGVLLSWLSTTLAVNKFLRMRYDELFY